MRDANIQDWIGELTAAGYDIVGVNGGTARGDWNANHPMPRMDFHMQRDGRDIVISCYATNSRRWTIYGTAFTGKAPNQHFGYRVKGTRMHSISDFDALKEFLA